MSELWGAVRRWVKNPQTEGLYFLPTSAILGPSWRRGDWQANWLNAGIIVLPVLMTVILGLYTPLTVATAYWTGFYTALMSFTVTAGYHRCYAHRSFTPGLLLKLYFAVFGAGCFQGSLKWWCRNHRIHHRYIDTDQDPYNAKRGFWYSHVGWMLMKQEPKYLGRADITDLNEDWIVRWQHKHYLPIALFTGLILPSVVPALWGDATGGYVYAGLLRMIFVHHATFCVNSLAHSNLFGATQTFTDHTTAHDSLVTALVTCGEGYHNFHHEFPQDYRNALRWWQYDPTKWFIRACGAFHLATDLVRFPQMEIEKDRLQMSVKYKQESLAREEQSLSKVTRVFDASILPEISMDDLRDSVAAGRKLIVIKGLVVDCDKCLDVGKGLSHGDSSMVWYAAHPGGWRILQANLGKDATDDFTGKHYKHSRAAHNMIDSLAIGRAV